MVRPFSNDDFQDLYAFKINQLLIFLLDSVKKEMFAEVDCFWIFVSDMLPVITENVIYTSHKHP